MNTKSSRSTTVSARADNEPVTHRAMATAVVAMIATQGVRRRGSTRANTLGSKPSDAIPYVSLLAMIIVSSAPLATATRAIRLNRRGGTPTSAADTTASKGPEDAASSSAGRTTETARPTRT